MGASGLPQDGAATEKQQRSVSRYRKLFFGGSAAVISKSISALTTLISIPLTVHYLGDERFGMWMTVSALVTLAGFADFGIGNGLVSTISHRDGKGDTDGIARFVSSAFFALTGIAVLILAIFSVTYFFVPWPRVFSVTSQLASQEAGPTTAIFIACFCASLPLAVAQRVQMALQESWLSNIWISIGNILGMAGVVTAIVMQEGLPYLALGMYGGPVLAGIGCGIMEFMIRRPQFRPRLRLWSSQVLPSLFRTGSIFFLLQILTVIGLGGIDNILVSSMAGAAAVAPFAVMLKYAQTVLIGTVFLQPLWPAVGEAMGRKEYDWAWRALKHASRWTLVLGGCVGLVTALFGGTIIHAWTGITPPDGLKYGFAVCIVVLSYIGVVATFLNNEILVQKQFGILFFATALSLILKVAGLHYWGISAMPWATAIAFGTIFCAYGMVIVKRSLMHLTNERSSTV